MIRRFPDQPLHKPVVLSQRTNLLAERGKPVDMLCVRDKADGDNVRLLTANAAESSKLDLFQEVETLLAGQLLGEHLEVKPFLRGSSVYTTAST
ncbi:MAG TPA: hypothetical protein VFD48_12765 [Pyrinomonadaceae bacterium]|nr:hypothetical protein [Pyrinomonadaceae bacterium]